MIPIPRPTIRTAAAVLRKAPGPNPDPPAPVVAARCRTGLRCLAGTTLVSHTGPAGTGSGELTVRLSVLEGLDAPGRDDLDFRAQGTTRVEVVERGSVSVT